MEASSWVAFLKAGGKIPLSVSVPGAWLTAHSAPSGVKPPHLRVIA